LERIIRGYEGTTVCLYPTSKMKTNAARMIPADLAAQSGPKMYRNLKFVLGFCLRLYPVLLTEGSSLRDMGITSLITVGLEGGGGDNRYVH
jgi:hypothetical protein